MADAKNAPLQISDPVIASGSTIVVTGINGLIGSHIADQLLAIGYKIRGAVRNVEKCKWLHDLYAPYGKDNFELIEVPDMVQPNAYDEIVKGAAGFIHVASPVSFDPDPNNVVPVAVNATLNAVKATFSQKSMKRFVLTSSSSAVYLPGQAQDKEVIFTTESYNEAAVKAAWEPPPYEQSRAFSTYAASKTLGEQAMWKFYNEHKAERPDFVCNSVLPNANYGLLLHKNQGFPTTIGMAKMLWDGDKEGHIKTVEPQFYVDVQDDARLHAAALLLPEVEGERVFAFAGVFNINEELNALRKARPNKKFPEDEPNVGIHRAKVPNARAEALLKKVGRQGWTSLEDSFAKMVPAYEA